MDPIDKLFQLVSPIPDVNRKIKVILLKDFSRIWISYIFLPIADSNSCFILPLSRNKNSSVLLF